MSVYMCTIRRLGSEREDGQSKYEAENIKDNQTMSDNEIRQTIITREKDLRFTIR
jgi:hypothetical protein